MATRTIFWVQDESTKPPVFSLKAFLQHLKKCGLHYDLELGDVEVYVDIDQDSNGVRAVKLRCTHNNKA